MPAFVKFITIILLEKIILLLKKQNKKSNIIQMNFHLMSVEAFVLRIWLSTSPFLPNPSITTPASTAKSASMRKVTSKTARPWPRASVTLKIPLWKKPSINQDSRTCGTSARTRLTSARTASSAICVRTAAASSKIRTTYTPSRPSAPTTPTSACGKGRMATCLWRSAAPTAARRDLCPTRNGLRN